MVKVGRIAGQFAKPRTAPLEKVGELEIPVFRGHMVNDDAPTLDARRPDPARLIAAYHQSASTLNLLRAFTKGGFADLSQVHMWNQQFVASSREGERYEAIAAEIDRALRFHDGLRDRPRLRGEPAPGRLLHEPRGPHPRLRGGPDPQGLAYRRLVRHLGPPGLVR